MKTISVKMRQTQSGRHPDFFAVTGQYHCRLGHTYDVPEGLALAWLAADPPVAERARAARKPTTATAEEGVTNDE